MMALAAGVASLVLPLRFRAAPGPSRLCGHAGSDDMYGHLQSRRREAWPEGDVFECHRLGCLPQSGHREHRPSPGDVTNSVGDTLIAASRRRIPPDPGRRASRWTGTSTSPAVPPCSSAARRRTVRVCRRPEPECTHAQFPRHGAGQYRRHRQALGVVVHNSTIGTDIVQSGGGGGSEFTPSERLSTSSCRPVYSDYEDNTISGATCTSTGLTSCYFGALRNKIGGSATFANNIFLETPIRPRTSATWSPGNLLCTNNVPAVQWGDSATSGNARGLADQVGASPPLSAPSG